MLETLGAIGGVASGIGSLVGGIGGLFGRSNESLKAAKWTAAYNHPVEQMKRLRQAGLNPNLVYGSGAGTVAGNTQMAPEAQSNDIFSRAGRAGQSLAQMSSLAQLQSVKAQTRLTEAQAEREEKENRLLGDKTSRDDPSIIKLFSRHAGQLSDFVSGKAKPVADRLAARGSDLANRVGDAISDMWRGGIPPLTDADLFKRFGRSGPTPPPSLRSRSLLEGDLNRIWSAIKSWRGWYPRGSKR